MSDTQTSTPRSDHADSPQLDAALDHAARGWRVFPLCRPTPDHGCCTHHPQCNHPGKVPLIKKWTTQATTDEATIRQWWARWPDANVGILTGETSDVLVLDIDNRHTGTESLERLQATYGSLPKTLTVRTGDGLHAYFRYGDLGVKNGTHLASGVEVRTNNGSVVAAGSRHVSGADYEWLPGAAPKDISLADFPGAWFQRQTEIFVAADRDSGYLGEGHRNAQLTRIGGALRRQGVSGHALDEALKQVNAIDGDPPLPAGEVQAISQSLERYEAGVSQHPWTGPAVGRRPSDRFRLRTVDELFELPPTEWLVEGIVQKHQLGIGHGPSGECKSFAFLDLALCIAIGRSWHGHAVTHGPVVFVAAEGGSGIRNRARAWLQEHEVSKIDSALFLLDDVQLLSPGDVQGLLSQIRLVCPNPALIVLDTLAACFVGGEENSAKDTGVALASARHIVNVTGATVVLVHHSGRQDAHRERGSSALKGNVDVMISVSKDRDIVTLTNTKQKDHEVFSPIHLRLKQVELVGSGLAGPTETSCVLLDGRSPASTNRSSPVNTSEQRAVDVLATLGRDGATSAEWRQLIETTHSIECPDKTFHNWRQALLQKGLVEPVPSKRHAYRVTETVSADGMPDGTP